MAVTINGVEMPVQFSYSPYLPSIKYSTQRTANAVVYQESCNPIVHGEDTFEFNCLGLCAEEKCLFDDIYYRRGFFTIVPLTFVGYNGEEYKVRLVSMSISGTTASTFSISGQFLVTSVILNICE